MILVCVYLATCALSLVAIAALLKAEGSKITYSVGVQAVVFAILPGVQLVIVLSWLWFWLSPPQKGVTKHHRGTLVKK